MGMLRRSKKTIAVPVIAARRAAAFRRRVILLGVKAGVGAAAIGAAGLAVAARRKRGASSSPAPAAPSAAPAAVPVPAAGSTATDEPTTPAGAEEPGVPLSPEENESVDEALKTSFSHGDEPGYP